MDRRQLFKALIGGSVVATVASAKESTTPLVIVESETPAWHWHQDPSGHWWLVRWTGWKSFADSLNIAGQHVAYPAMARFSRKRDQSRPFIYSSFPGVCATFRQGDMFTVSLLQEQRILLPEWPSAVSKADDLAKAERWSHTRLIAFMVKASRIDWERNRLLINLPSWELDRAIEAA